MGMEVGIRPFSCASFAMPLGFYYTSGLDHETMQRIHATGRGASWTVSDLSRRLPSNEPKQEHGHLFHAFRRANPPSGIDVPREAGIRRLIDECAGIESREGTGG